MSGMDRLTDEALITGWDNLKDNLPSDGHDAAEALFDYGDKLADALSCRASQAAPAPSDGLREALAALEEKASAVSSAHARKGGIGFAVAEMGPAIIAARAVLSASPAQEVKP